MKKVTLQKGKEKSLLRYHPWVFSGAVAKMDRDIANGDIVEVCDRDGNFLAMGHYHDNSIAVRIFSFEQMTPTYDFWKTKVENALRYRKTIGLLNNPETNMLRLINGEGDGLPGVIIDCYDGNAVLQFHSYGMYLLKDTFVQILRELLPDLKSIYNKSASTLTDTEMPEADGVLYGNLGSIIGKENGILFNIDIPGGQKTGFFLDQRDSRALVGSMAKGRRVLNMFCYSGGFSSYALRGGAAHVDSVDISRKAIDLTEQNIALLGEEAASRHSAYCEDVFKFLENMPDNAYDLIVLDPPAFAKHRESVENALKGYRRINRAAIRNIAPGGILFTFSCSQLVSPELFREAVFSAAAQAGREARILHVLHQGPDHPVNLFHPEGEYLKGLVLEISG